LKQALRNEKTDAISCSKELCASAAPCTGIASFGQKHRFSDKTGKKWLTNRFPKIISQYIGPIKPS
jgi:hypothetical protein